MSNNKTRARVIEQNGQLILVDPDSYAVAMAVGKHNCKHTLRHQRERVMHFSKRVYEKNLTPKDVVIVIINIDDRFGELGEHLTPGVDWQAIRDRGETPFARGLAGREGIQAFLDEFDKGAADKLRQAANDLAIMVADHQTVEVFQLADILDVLTT